MKTKTILKCDFCVIGAGAAGLSFASGAAQLGAKVVLVESHKMGGDCLNTGCVPSKALLAAARLRHTLRKWSQPDHIINFKSVMHHVESVITTIAPHDSIERFAGLGVQVLSENGTFVNPKEFETETTKIKAKCFIIATGSKPFIPQIPGLDQVPYYTNENIFTLTALPEKLVIIGGGPIGIEMAQAFHNLGSHVTVLEAGTILPKDDPEITTLLKKNLSHSGILLYEQLKIIQIESDHIRYTSNDGRSEAVSYTHLLIATGRRPRIENLNLSAAKVQHTPQGIVVNPQLKTSNSRIYAIGDCIGGYLFTHVAGYHAQIALRNSIFGLGTRIKTAYIPWVTYTDLELAHVGATETHLKKENIRYQAVTIPFHDNDRAQAERNTEGCIKALLSPKGRILGVTILGEQAGELIYPWVLALNNNLSISAIAKTMAPYPTMMELNNRIAGAFYGPKLFKPWIKKLVYLLLLRYST